jgi:hypothetical protein
MNQHNDIESRMDAALKQDVAAIGVVSSEVPASLRSLIASTPATSASVVTGAIAAKTVATKLALWSTGGLLVAAASYFAITSDDKTPINPQPESRMTPAAVTVDTPRPKADSAIAKAHTTPSQRTATSSTTKYTQAQVDSMMLHMQEPATKVIDSDSIKVRMSKKRKP